MDADVFLQHVKIFVDQQYRVIPFVDAFRFPLGGGFEPMFSVDIHENGHIEIRNTVRPMVDQVFVFNPVFQDGYGDRAEVLVEYGREIDA